MKHLVLALIIFMNFHSINAFVIDQTKSEIVDSFIDENKIDCLFNYEKNIKADSLANYVRNYFIETLKKWKNNGVKYYENDKNSVDLVSQTICFNTNRNKGLLFILSKEINTKKGSVAYEVVQTIKINEEWMFFSNGGIPDFLVLESELQKFYKKTMKLKMKNTDFSFINTRLKHFISHNYFSDSSCNSNDNFIDAYDFKYSDEGRYKNLLKETSLDKKIVCLKKMEQDIQFDSLSINVYKLFRDTLSFWQEKQLKYIQKSENILDTIDNRICFNDSKDKCLIFYLTFNKNNNTGFDNINFILGIRKTDQWLFYFKGLPSISLKKKDLKSQYPNIMKIVNGVNCGRLEEYLREMIAVNQFLDINCKINNEFVNKFYNDDLIENHEEFLNSK